MRLNKNLLSALLLLAWILVLPAPASAGEQETAARNFIARLIRQAQSGHSILAEVESHPPNEGRRKATARRFEAWARSSPKIQASACGYSCDTFGVLLAETGQGHRFLSFGLIGRPGKERLIGFGMGSWNATYKWDISNLGPRPDPAMEWRRGVVGGEVLVEGPFTGQE